MAQYSKITEYTGTEVISRTQAKEYLRVDFSTDDDYITDLIKIARVQVLKDTNQVVVETNITEYLSKWPSSDVITLQYPGEITSPTLKYWDVDNVERTLAHNTDYRVVSNMGLTMLELIKTFPLYDRIDAINFRYDVEPDNEDTIRPLKIAMYMLIQHYYDNRSAVSFLKADEMPLGYKSIIANYKNYLL